MRRFAQFLFVLFAVFVGCAVGATCIPEGAHCGNGGGTCCVGFTCGQNPDGSTSTVCIPVSGTTTTTLPSCIENGVSCIGRPNDCCSGLHCAQGAGQTVPTCQSFGTTTTTFIPLTTTSSTSSTSTSLGSTTSTTRTATTSTNPPTTTTLHPPPNAYPGADFLYTPADLALLVTKWHEPCAFTGKIVDPRTGQPANQLELAAMDWEYKEFSIEAIRYAEDNGITWDEEKIKNANFKFGGDYWLDHQAFPTGGHYQILQPTYVRQYTCDPITTITKQLVAKGVHVPELEQLAGLVPGPTSPPPPVIDTNVLDGLLTYTLGHYPPLTQAQCDALNAAEAAHMAHDMAFLRHDFAAAAANDPEVSRTQRAFEATALTIDQAVLFKWTWQGFYDQRNPQDVLDGLTRGVIQAHDNATLSFNCLSHKPPDVGAIVHYRMEHNFLHTRRATVHWLDKEAETVCATKQIQSCPYLTSRQWAAQF